MFVDIFLLHKHTSEVSHVSGGRAWVLVICAVVLNYVPFTRYLPVSTNGEFLRVIRGPYLDLIDISITQTSLLHEVHEVLTVVVVVRLTHQQVLLAAYYHFKISDKILRQFSSS